MLVCGLVKLQTTTTDMERHMPLVLTADMYSAPPPSRLQDDQDHFVDPSDTSLNAMPKTKALITDQGAQFSNFYVNTPVCCPSRFVGEKHPPVVSCSCLYIVAMLWPVMMKVVISFSQEFCPPFLCSRVLIGSPVSTRFTNYLAC